MKDERVMAKCGHLTLQEGEVIALQHLVTFKMPFNDAGGFDYCLECIADMSIPCSWCGEPICIGSPVTLYGSVSGEGLREDATPYDADPRFYVGCLGWNCAQTGADRAGFWLPGEDSKGRVHRMRNLLDMAMKSGGVLVGDLSDMSEQPTPLGRDD